MDEVHNLHLKVLNGGSGNWPEEARESPAQEAFRMQLNHKLRTPLNAIIGFAELLALDPNGSRSEQDVQQILKSARELLAIIEAELDEHSLESGRPAQGEKRTPEPCDVLYVEDDMVNFTLVERILEFRPALKLMHAECGATGLSMAEMHQPKMVLLDLNLPDMHGAEVLRRLQQNELTEKIPVVVLSANATPSQIERLLTAGARNYLTKPFDIDPFLAVVDELVAK
jgi:CheY-like chemotaxis protein